MREHQLRRCIACRRSVEKETLLRFVLRGDVLVWDKEHRLPGRGAYLHPLLACWGKMLERKRWQMALKGIERVEDSNLRSVQVELRDAIKELQISDESDSKGRKAKMRL